MMMTWSMVRCQENNWHKACRWKHIDHEPFQDMNRHGRMMFMPWWFRKNTTEWMFLPFFTEKAPPTIFKLHFFAEKAPPQKGSSWMIGIVVRHGLWTAFVYCVMFFLVCTIDEAYSSCKTRRNIVLGACSLARWQHRRSCHMQHMLRTWKKRIRKSGWADASKPHNSILVQWTLMASAYNGANSHAVLLMSLWIGTCSEKAPA